MNSYFYTGVGSRKITASVWNDLKSFALELEALSFKVRTGNAQGCDQVFRTYAKSVVYHPKQIISNLDHWAYREVQNHIPTDRAGFEEWTPYVKALLARNMMQVLGDDGKTPSKFLLCWAPSTKYTDSSSGGTGYAIRCALAYDVPVYNLYSPQDYHDFEFYLQSLKS